MFRIMLVDDEPNIIRALTRTLKGPDCEIEGFTDPEMALRFARVTPVDLVLADYRMPGMDGIAFLKQMLEIQPEALRVVVSGHADLDLLIGAINEAEIYRFIAKPWQEYDLKSTVRAALAERRLRAENERLLKELRQRESLLAHVERLHPGLTRVNWAADGSILLDEEGTE